MIRPRAARDRGAVLVTVLVLIAVMSVVAAAILDDVRFGIRRAVNLRLQDQARWYVLGTEALARGAIRLSWEQRPNISTLQSPWARGPQRYPVDGGFLEGVLSDGGNCFNLNSLVQGVAATGTLSVREAALDEYRGLLTAVGVPNNEVISLSNAAADWIDSDRVPRTGGAEDFFYERRDPPGRPANTLMSEVSELRAVAGYGQDLYRTLRPFLCALPTTAASTLNINMLRPDQAVLLVALLDGRLTEDRAADLIASRPASGYARPDDFWSRPVFDDMDLTETTRARVDVQTWYYTLAARVLLQDTYATGSALFRLYPAGRIELVARRHEEDE